MTIIHFIRLLYRYSLLLVLVPLVMAVIVYFITKNETREYESSTVVYTGIASGYSIESGASTKVDFFAANNAFDNLINIITSRSTLEETALRLFVRTAKADAHIPLHISADHHRELVTSLPNDIANILQQGDEDEQVKLLQTYMNQSDTNYVYRLLNMDHKHYSIVALSKVKVSRISNSDLLELYYKADDPGICHQTLIILNQVFSERHKSLKGNQTDMVVKYFEAQLAKANKHLKTSEDELLQFNKKNNIINYYEQTKYIASQKEDLDLEYQREQMKIAGAKAAISRLEAKMGFQYKVKLQNQQLLNDRKRLAVLSSELMMAKMVKTDSTHIIDEMDAVKAKMAHTVDSLQTLAHTAEGVSMEEVIGNWLKQIIIYEETNARLQVLTSRRNDFRTVYKQFAPLGATIKRIEREIDVREREYLSLLHSLALAKLKQQNIELSSNLKLVDHPYYPIKPLPSKRMFLVIIAAMASFVFLLGVVVSLEFLDTNIRTAERLQMFSGLACAGVYPRISLSNQSLCKDLIARINTLFTQHSIRNASSKTEIILIMSTESGEGKSFVAQQLARSYTALSLKTLLATYDDSGSDYDETIDFITVTDSPIHATSVSSLLNVDTSEYDKIVFELPAISNSIYSPLLLKSAHHVFFVFRANRAYSKVDTKMLEDIVALAPNKVETILNGAEVEVLETELGSIPKKRSWIRKMVKKLFLFKHFEKERLSGKPVDINV